MTRAERERLSKRINRKRDKLQPRVRKLMRDAIQRTVAPMVALVERGAFEGMRAIDISEQYFRDAYKQTYKDVGIPFVRIASESIQKAASVDVDYWQQYFDDWVTQNLGQQITWVTNVTRDMFIKAVADVVAMQPSQGLSVNEMSDAIMDRIGFEQEWRARRLARTEIITASSHAQQEAIRQTGEGVRLMKVWITAHDGRVRGMSPKDQYSHVELDGETVDFTGTYSNGARYPGDPRLDPGDRINCRCAEVYVFKDELV